MLAPFLISSISTSSAEAMYTKNSELKNISSEQTNQESNFQINKFPDGRLEAFPQASILSENQQNIYLSEMGFSTEEIEQIPSKSKEEIIEEGGIKLDTLDQDFVSQYRDLKGNNYVITDENREQIQEIQKQDLMTLSKNDALSFSTQSYNLGYVEEGRFKGFGTLIYLGKTADAKEFKYSVRTNFMWSARPPIINTGTVGHAVDNDMKVVGSNIHSDGYVKMSTLNKSSVYGATASVDVHADGSGYIASEVRIPVSKAGLTGVFANAYILPYTTSVGHSLSLGPATVDYGNPLGLIYTWRSTFKIGNNY